MPKTRPPISYTSRDFKSIKDDLINYIKVYYPDTYKDFNDASFGALMVDLVAYIGDILSYYVDYQVNESFIETALQQNSILKIAKQMGYKIPGYPSSTGICSFYVAIPAQTNGGQPNVDLLPILKEGTTMASDSGASFILSENIDFSKAGLEVTVGDVSLTGIPQNYIYKSYGKVVSGETRVKTFTIGNYVKFLSLDVGDENITEIISVTDSNGNEYYEVDYLSQDTIYKSIKNIGPDSAYVPYILKKLQTFRRFTTEFDIDGTCKIQFGGGAEADLIEDNYADPSSAVLQFYGKNYNSDLLFDPNQLIRSEKLGISPANTTITVEYRANPNSNANVPIASVKTITNPIVEFRSSTYTKNEALNLISPFEVDNEEPILGYVDIPTLEELRLRSASAFATQNRAVTKQDYINLIYRMPSKYGAVKRVNVIQDKESIKRDINIYVISVDENGDLTTGTASLKQNIKNWIADYKMINDVVDILDGSIVNIGIDFEVVVELNKDVNNVIAECISVLKNKYSQKFEMGEPIYLTDIYKLLNSVKYVVDTKNVKITAKIGSDYSSTQYSVQDNLSKDGRYLSIPQTHIFEIKDLDNDIRGVAV